MTVDELFQFLEGRAEYPSDDAYIAALIEQSHGRISMNLLDNQ